MAAQRERKNPEIGEDTPILPPDLVESILVRLPVKSLLRFKTVCKLWNAIISDPHFVKTQSEASSTYFLLCQRDRASCFRLLKFENERFQRASVLELPFDDPFILCSCNGIVLLKDHGTAWSKRITYVLWNPCSRMHTTILWQGNGRPVAHGLCHDSTTDDYKVVMITDKSMFSVFSCKERAWTKIDQAFPNSQFLEDGGVSVEGTFYWNSNPEIFNDTIILFDGIHDKCGKLQLSHPVEKNREFLQAVPSIDRGCLVFCLYYFNKEVQDYYFDMHYGREWSFKFIQENKNEIQVVFKTFLRSMSCQASVPHRRRHGHAVC